MADHTKSMPVVMKLTTLKTIFENVFHGSVITSALTQSRDLELMIEGLENFLTQYDANVKTLTAKFQGLITEGLQLIKKAHADQSKSTTSEQIIASYPGALS